MKPGRLAKTASVVVAAAIGWSLSVSGCGRSQSPRNGSEPGRTASRPIGECYNPFFPVTPDGTLEYESTFSNNLQVYSYSVTFSYVSAGSFIQHQEVTGGVAPASYDSPLDRAWRCQPEGLVSSEYADLSRPESRLKFETLDVGGVAIPTADRWQKGAKWNYGYTVRGQMSFVGAPKPVDVEGRISVTAEIGAQEKVAVPAGVYEAVKVHSRYNEALTMKGSESMTMNMSFMAQSWYAREVGLVKEISEDLRVTTVLKSVTK